MNRHSGELGLMTLRMNRFKAWAPCLYLVLVAIAVAADMERNEHDGEDPHVDFADYALGKGSCVGAYFLDHLLRGVVGFWCHVEVTVSVT